MGAFIGAVLTALVDAYRYKWRHIGKSWVGIIPETQGTEATFIRVKLKEGKFDMVSRNHDAKRGDLDRMLPQGNVAYQAKGDLKGPIHLMTSYGANLKAPTKLEAAQHLEKIAVADWLRDYQRQPTAKEAEPNGTFTTRLQAAFEKAKDYATWFLVWDPLAYYKACDENDMQDFLNSQGGVKDPWYAKAAFVGVLMVGMLVLILLAVVGMKVLPAIQAQAGQ